MLHRYSSPYGDRGKTFAYGGDDTAGDQRRLCLRLQRDGDDRAAERNRIRGDAADRARRTDPFALGAAVNCRCRTTSAKEVLQAHPYREDDSGIIPKTLSSARQADSFRTSGVGMTLQFASLFHRGNL